ncbi:MAG: thiamine phosphate synthase [Flavobacteriales bacterium]|nr:thiamine phosphate synthase [Flavobacteriales bacterium]
MRVLFSYPTQLENEVELINKEMTSGKWDLFHLRKPRWSEEEVMNLLSGLSDEVRTKTVIHQNFKGSCHSFEEVEKLDGEKEYCFLSPVFDSISKQGYKAKFDKEELRQFLKKDRKIKVIGLGGVNEENYSELIEMGFDGGAFLGSVWRKYE